MATDGFSSSTNEDSTSWFHSTFVSETTHLISHQTNTSRLWDQHEWKNRLGQTQSPLGVPSHKRMGYSTSTWNFHHFHLDNNWSSRMKGSKQRAMIAPTTQLDTSGLRPHSGNNDICTTNKQGYAVRIHKRLRRALFTPFNNGYPINTEDYRKTIIRQPGKEEIIIEDDYQQKEKKDQNKIIEGSAWIGGTWLKPKASASRSNMPRATTPRQIMQEHQKAKIATGKKEEASTSKPATRHYGKQPQKPSIDIPGSGQHISPPDPTDKTSDYWIREGHLWKRAHVVPRTSYYCPELPSDGPAVDNLLPSRMTIIKPLHGNRPRRIDDEWTTEPQPQHSQQWTGSTNFV